MLAERIVCSSDRKALRELHNHRTPFRLRVDRPMTFVEFVTALSETPWALRLYGCDRSALELAQDRMIDQFSLLPDNRTEETHRGDVAGFSEAYARLSGFRARDRIVREAVWIRFCLFLRGVKQ
jgi:hypothetical protein